MDTIDTAATADDRRLAERVLALIVGLMLALFGYAMDFARTVADGMFPERAKRRIEAEEAAERAKAVRDATAPLPQPVPLREVEAPSRQKTVGALVKQYARKRLYASTRQLDGAELGTLGQTVQSWMFNLTDDECRAIHEARTPAVTMHVIARGQVEGVRTVADGAYDAARKLDMHKLRQQNQSFDKWAMRTHSRLDKSLRGQMYLP